MTLDEYLNLAYPGLPVAQQNAEFGRAMRVKRQSVERWRKCQQSPSLQMAYRIYKVSRGEVTPLELLSQVQKREAMSDLG